MRSGRRLNALMIGLAALTGTLVALALSGGLRLPSGAPTRSIAATTATASPTTNRSPSPTPTQAPSPSRSNPPDPLADFRLLAGTWRPTETTAIAERLTPTGTRIFAVSMTGGSPVPLLDLPRNTQWHIRLDGTAIAFTVDVGTAPVSRTRIALLSFPTGFTSWVTADEPGVSHRGPRWSNDGNVIYYARTSVDGTEDLGVYRLRADGSNLTQLRAPTSGRGVDVVGLSPDGLTLVLSKIQEGGSVDLLDLNTRATRSFTQGAAAIDAWRVQRPRALVSVGGPAGGRSQLVLWDDQAPTGSPTPLIAQAPVFGSDWDPTMTHLVVATSPSAVGTAPPQLVTMDASGQGRTTLSGTDGASSPFWFRSGIVYLWTAGQTRPSEVRIAQPSGSAAPRRLYSDVDIVRLTYVSP